MSEYHGRGDGVPRLSATTASWLVTHSPAHAWWHHSVLNPDYQRTEDTKFDVGNVAHAVLLDGREWDDVLYVIHEPDYRKNVAKEQRDYARTLGKVPLLAHQRDDVLRMVDAVRVQMAKHSAQPPLLSDGHPEQVLLWEEDGIAMKAKLDWLHADHSVVDDLKTTSRSASPSAYSRALFNVGGDVQAAFYVRAVRALYDTEAQFRWVIVESQPPFALSVVSPAPDLLSLGQRKVDWAIRRWRECLETDSWPAYGDRVAYAEVPGYVEADWLEREMAMA